MPSVPNPESAAAGLTAAFSLVDQYCPDVLRERQPDGIAFAWIEFVERGIKRAPSRLDSKPRGRTRDPVCHPRGSSGMLQFTRDRIGDEYLAVQRAENVDLLD